MRAQGRYVKDPPNPEGSFSAVSRQLFASKYVSLSRLDPRELRGHRALLRERGVLLLRQDLAVHLETLAVCDRTAVHSFGENKTRRYLTKNLGVRQLQSAGVCVCWLLGMTWGFCSRRAGKLYKRSQILHVNTHAKALAEIYKIHTFAQLSKLNLLYFSNV